MVSHRRDGESNKHEQGRIIWYLIVPVDDLPPNFSVPEPPGNRGVGDPRGNAGQVHGVLIPAPLIIHGLLFKGRGELNLKTESLQE